MKQRRSASFPFPVALRAGFALLLGTTLALASRAGAQAPPPPPVPNPNATPLPTGAALPTLPPLPTAAPTPAPTPTPAPRGKHKKAAAPAASPGGPSPTPTPTSPAFATLDGTWEVQLQYTDRTLYSYFDLKQSAAGALSGRWRRDGKLYPLEGSYDGRNFKMVVKGPDGDYNLSGFVEAASDMIGLVDDGKGKDPVPFTAEHRAAQPHGILRRGDTVPAGPPPGGAIPNGAPGGGQP